MTKVLFSILLITLIAGNIPQTSAIFYAKIIPPSPYTVYAGQTYTLPVNVQYDVPDQSAQQFGPIELWVSSPPSQSSKINFWKSGGKGTHPFTLQLTAPTQPGSYVLGIKLLANSKQHYGDVIDTATVNYQVILPTVNDWAVTRVWITPASPTVGDIVNFHATIALKSTTGKGQQSALVASFLNKAQFEKAQILNFPGPSSINIKASKTWTAEEGTHKLAFVVEDANNYPDPSPNDNVMEITFSVEPYYAIISWVSTDPETVDSGESFDAEVLVSYKFPESTNLRIGAIFPGWNISAPIGPNATKRFLGMPATSETLDTVSGEGNKSYTLGLVAPVLPHMASEYKAAFVDHMGYARVEFDRGAGRGWEYTEPGFWRNFTVRIQRPNYYAVFDSLNVVYLGRSFDSSMNMTSGRFSITMQVRYLLPLETGLRLNVYGFNGSAGLLSVEEMITQTESVERTSTYTYEYTFPLLSFYEGNYTTGFDATIEYMVDGSWYHGDDESASALVSIIHPEFGRMRARTILDDIWDFFKKTFRL